MGIEVGPEWESVCRPPRSVMKANQLGWRRRVLQEESQSTGPNEAGLEIRERQRGCRGTKDGRRTEIITEQTPRNLRGKMRERKRRRKVSAG